MFDNEKIKLLIQINCLNEADNLHIVFNQLPKKLKGVDVIETLIIDDGSSDNTYEVAKELGATYVHRNYGNKGIPRSMNTGLFIANRLGVDILVNMDADNQHDPKDIEKLIKPILEKRADIVHGERPVSEVTHTSLTKKILQKVGAIVVKAVSGFNVKDASSGFRALNREAICKINLIYDYAEPLEYIIQARNKNLTLEFIDITPNEAVRPSKLISSTYKYVLKSASVILDNLIVYRSPELFVWGGVLAFIFGFVVFFVRVAKVNQTGLDYLTLLNVSIVAIIASIQLFLFGLLAKNQRANRKISEEGIYLENLSKNGKGF